MTSEKYQEQRTKLIEYMKMKIDQQDWHGVSDAANDLRDLDSEWKGRNDLQLELEGMANSCPPLI